MICLNCDHFISNVALEGSERKKWLGNFIYMFIRQREKNDIKWNLRLKFWRKRRNIFRKKKSWDKNQRTKSELNNHSERDNDWKLCVRNFVSNKRLNVARANAHAIYIYFIDYVIRHHGTGSRCIVLRFWSIEIFHRISFVCIFYMLFIAHLHHITGSVCIYSAKYYVRRECAIECVRALDARA